MATPLMRSTALWEAPTSTINSTSDYCKWTLPSCPQASPPSSSHECSALVSQLNNSQESSESDITFSENLLGLGSSQEPSPAPSRFLSHSPALSLHASGCQLLLEALSPCAHGSRTPTAVDVLTDDQRPASSSELKSQKQPAIPYSKASHLPVQGSPPQDACTQACAVPEYGPSHACDQQTIALKPPPPPKYHTRLQRITMGSVVTGSASESKRARFEDPSSDTQSTTTCSAVKQQRTAAPAGSPTAQSTQHASGSCKFSLQVHEQPAGDADAVEAEFTAQRTQRAIIGILKKVSGVSACKGASGASCSSANTKRVRFMNLKKEEEEAALQEQFNWEAGAAYALWSMTRAF